LDEHTDRARNAAGRAGCAEDAGPPFGADGRARQQGRAPLADLLFTVTQARFVRIPYPRRALDILSAYKLTGNFHINLEIVLKDLGAFDKVAYKIESETLLPFRLDRRQVAFWPNKNVPMERFDEIMRSLTGRIGFDATPPWWRIVVGRRHLGGSR
jgi:hypothetical protein